LKLTKYLLFSNSSVTSNFFFEKKLKNTKIIRSFSFSPMFLTQKEDFVFFLNYFAVIQAQLEVIPFEAYVFSHSDMNLNPWKMDGSNINFKKNHSTLIIIL
jgi:hypothetical protein